MKNPNAVAGSSGGGVVVLVVFILGLLHVAVDPTVAAAIATAAAGLILFIGHNGLIGTWRRILRGDQPPPKS